MAHVLLPLVLFGGCALLASLLLDRASNVQLEAMIRFPFKDMPATNGVLLGFLFFGCLALIAWLRA
jgi:hypothetical protein